ncbi:hypothetical protein MKW98_016247 [Papaver atlanticum]|uniref:PGG domain-containing protein n=1 Tax=Papaver atlanticum TaxID=357466 RepID=A0AAD4SGV6_9MAGN|nr:hypothetical protein MKW98_016247 [Papaver atlanticum]
MWKQLQKMFGNEDDSRLNNLDETFTSFCRTPLHIAVMSGDIEFATKILSMRPDLALKQDSNGFTPLHLASVRRSLPMVSLLLENKPAGATTVQDQDGRTPLHLAAMKNRVDIMKLLLEEGLPEAIHLKNHNNGETILHCCVKSDSSIKTLELLVNQVAHAPLSEENPNPISVSSTDNSGNTILHLAAKMGNMKITNYLLLNDNVKININVVNEDRLKALDMLSQAEGNDLKYGFYSYHVRHETHKSKSLSENGDHQGLKDRVNALMVVATLVAGIAFQAAMNPPGGVWQDDSKVNSNTDPVTFAYYLESRYGSSLSDGFDKYYDENVPDHAYSDEQYDGLYNLVDGLMSLQGGDDYYDMTVDGLILDDSAFTNVVSNYSNSWNSSNGVFFPYLIRYAGYPILAYKYPTEYVYYMITNGVAFLVSLTIIFLVICGFMNETSVTQVRILVVLMCISIGCIAFGYMSIIEAMVPDFYTQAVYVYLVLQIFLGVCCLLGVLWFFIWTAWKIFKLRKKTRNHHIGIGVINYLKALFFSMDEKTIGKLVLFIVCYGAFRLIGGYVNHIDKY